MLYLLNGTDRDGEQETDNDESHCTKRANTFITRLIYLLKPTESHLSEELSEVTPASSRVSRRFQTRNQSRKEGVLLRRSGQSRSVRSHQLHSAGLGTLRAGSSDTTRLIRS